MDDESVLAVSAGPEDVTPVGGEDITTETEGQTDGQAAEGAEDTGPAEEAKKTAAKERREREKAYRDRLVAEKNAALEEAAKAEARMQRIKQAGQQEKPPVESDYTDPLEYVAAKAVWAAQQKAMERDAGEAGAAAEEARKRAEELRSYEQQVIDRAFAERIAEAQTRYADFAQVAYAQDVPINAVMTDLIKTSDLGPDVAYFLGSNKALAAQIAQLNPVEAARAIGRIEATLAAPQPRKTTTAPPPISPVKGSARAVPNPEEMSFADYRAARKAGKIR